MTDKPSLDPDEPYNYTFFIEPIVTKKLQNIFYVEIYIEFGWHGSSDRYRYNLNVRLIYDSANSKYQTNIIAKSKIPRHRE